MNRLRPTFARPHTPRRAAYRAFTLVEMIVVIAIVAILVVIGLPAAQQLWENQRRVDTVNMIQGMLTTARAKAIQGGEAETGLFFFVDDKNAQRVVSIRRAEPSRLNDRLVSEGYDAPGGAGDSNYRRALENVFEVTLDRAYTIPSPIRVVPRYVVETKDDNQFLDDWDLFTPAELANNTFEVLAAPADNNQRHRNFFTIVFTPGGEVRPKRDVLILDVDTLVDTQARGDVTGLRVGFDPTTGKGTVGRYYLPNRTAAFKQLGDGQTAVTLPFLVHDADTADAAINFPSVDGLLVYDESLFNEFTDPNNKRDFLLRTAQPLYINRLTGAIVEGPVGEMP